MNIACFNADVHSLVGLFLLETDSQVAHIIDYVIELRYYEIELLD